MVIFQKEAITFNSSVPLKKLKEHEVTCPTGVVLSLREDPLERALTGTEVLLIFWSWATDKFTVYKNASGTAQGNCLYPLGHPKFNYGPSTLGRQRDAMRARGTQETGYWAWS